MPRAITAAFALVAGLVLVTSLIATAPGAAAPAPDATQPHLTGTAGGIPAVDPADADADLDSGSVFWAGQDAYFDGGEVVADVANASADERTFQIRRVTDDGEVGRLASEVLVDRDGEALVHTGSLDGQFVIRYDGQTVYVQAGTGYTSSPPDGASVTVESSAWEVATQTLSAGWSDDRVFRNERPDLQLRSNRAAYEVEVSGDGLGFADLEGMFDSADYAPAFDREADDDVIVLSATGDAALPVSFADFDTGEYTLHIDVSDTDASATTTIRVGRTATSTPTRIATATPRRTEEPTSTPTTTEPGPTATPGTSTARRTGTATTTAAPGTESPGQPGFGVAVAVVGVLAPLLLGRRRR